MRILLLNATPSRHGKEPVCHEIHVDVHVHGEPPTKGVDLVAVDAARMTPDDVQDALAWVQEIRRREPSARIAFFWPNPPIETVVKALRAGVNDFIKEPLSSARLHRILARCGTPSDAPRAARALAACGALLEQTTFTEDEADLANVLQRERKLHVREAALAAETKRLEDLREVLQHRENELRLRAMRLDEEFMQLQNDADLHLTAAVAPRGYDGSLPTRVEFLGTNRQDIESRERLLSDTSDGT